MPELDRPASHPRVAGLAISQTGPLVGESPSALGGDVDGPVLISLSTISYPGQHELLQRLVHTIGALELPAIVTTGPSIDPRLIDAPRNVSVRRFVPHDDILPSARLVVGHGGHGTTMRALAHGVPVLVVPISRHADHVLVGNAVDAAGVGTMVPKDQADRRFGSAVQAVLADPVVHSTARRFAALLGERDAAAAATDAIEELLRVRSS